MWTLTGLAADLPEEALLVDWSDLWVLLYALGQEHRHLWRLLRVKLNFIRLALVFQKGFTSAT
jgi:hypothetical protein